MSKILKECSPPQTCHVSCVTLHVSRVTCHLSRVTCQMSKKKLHFFFLRKNMDKVVELVVGGSLINGAYPL